MSEHRATIGWQRSSADFTLLRMTHEGRREPLHSGDSVDFTIPYKMDDDLHDQRHTLFGQVIRADAYVDGDRAATVEKAVEEMRNS